MNTVQLWWNRHIVFAVISITTVLSANIHIYFLRVENVCNVCNFPYIFPKSWFSIPYIFPMILLDPCDSKHTVTAKRVEIFLYIYLNQCHLLGTIICTLMATSIGLSAKITCSLVEPAVLDSSAHKLDKSI